MEEVQGQSQSVDIAADLTIAWLSNPNTRATVSEVPEFLRAVHSVVASLSASDTTASATAPATSQYTPAVSAKRSLASKDHIISLIDGKPYKTLRRHLSTHGLTPEQYRERFSLKPDYPMVAEAYAEKRRELAKKIGLGRKPRDQQVQGSGKAGRPAKRQSPKG